MLYPFWHEMAIRFLDTVLVLIWIAGHVAAVRRNPAPVQNRAGSIPENGNPIPFHDYVQEPRHNL